jgi:hypothetical protein
MCGGLIISSRHKEREGVVERLGNRAGVCVAGVQVRSSLQGAETLLCADVVKCVAFCAAVW